MSKKSNKSSSEVVANKSNPKNKAKTQKQAAVQMGPEITLAQRLARCADACGLHVEHAAVNEKRLAEFGLTIADMTGEVIRDAKAIDRAYETSLKQRIEKLAPKPAAAAKPAEAKQDKPAKNSPDKKDNGPRKQVQIFGHSATAVLRWMGKNNWNAEDAGVAMTTMGAKYISDTTIRIQLRAGAKGERGEPAPITREQAKKLKEAAQ